MCIANAYLNRQGKAELIMENVESIQAVETNVWNLSGLLGEEKRIVVRMMCLKLIDSPSGNRKIWSRSRRAKNFTGGIWLIFRGKNFECNEDIGQIGHFRMHTSLDAVIVVVEPSLESVSIAEKTKALTESGAARFAGAVINKIRSGDCQKRLLKELKRTNIPALGCLRFHERLLDDGLSGLPVNPEETGDEAGIIVNNLLDFIREDLSFTQVIEN